MRRHPAICKKFIHQPDGGSGIPDPDRRWYDLHYQKLNYLLFLETYHAFKKFLYPVNIDTFEMGEVCHDLALIANH